MPVLELNERWLLNLLDTIDEGIHAVDVDGVTLVYNQAAAVMDGLRQSDVLGKHVLSVFPSLGQDTSTLMQVLKTGKPLANRSQTYTNYLGLKVHTVNTTLPIVIAGRVVGAVEIAKDLTQVKNLAEQVLSLQAQVVGSARGNGGTSVRKDGANAIYYFPDILTVNPEMQAVKSRAQLAAKTSSPVLVYGETGTGKELLVHAIHNASPRQGNPFLALNCAALPATLLEGILFGTVRGSFTGAGDRAGLFELADGGTLFLDEIQSMPLELQAKLLRVLQAGEVLRVGDTRLRHVDVRVIAAMNQSPEVSLARRELRQDLYYRINVVRLDLPPLRKRPQDIPVLVNYFIDKWNARFHVNVTGVTDAVMQVFAAYHWPGNIRELENAIEAAMNLVHEGKIQLDVLPTHIPDSTVKAGQSASPGMDKDSGVAEFCGEPRDHRGLETHRDALRRTPADFDSTVWGITEANTPESPETGTMAIPGATAAQGSGDFSWIHTLAAHGMNEFWSSLEDERAADPGFAAISRAFERMILLRALESTGGNVKQAAAKLGMPRQTLQYRVKQTDITVAR